MPENTMSDWRSLLSDETRHLQNKTADKEAEVRLFRMFEPDVVPGLLQIPEYARACLNHDGRLDDAPDDLDDAIQARMRRQEILHDETKRFHFVITEATLRHRYCSTSGMLAQLDRLLSSLSLPNAQLGVIGFDATYKVGP
ncbi:DUF5753 domain-containing protein [Lentzea alba]|uniref:Scr1 family TA system antitoxin-like transcriptional regulator n=1 Tax=Lentzea alba TaxID=2714351 RepID=UPI0039BF6C41